MVNKRINKTLRENLIIIVSLRHLGDPLVVHNFLTFNMSERTFVNNGGCDSCDKGQKGNRDNLGTGNPCYPGYFVTIATMKVTIAYNRNWLSYDLENQDILIICTLGWS